MTMQLEVETLSTCQNHLTGHSFRLPRIRAWLAPWYSYSARGRNLPIDSWPNYPGFGGRC